MYVTHRIKDIEDHIVCLEMAAKLCGFAQNAVEKGVDDQAIAILELLKTSLKQLRELTEESLELYV